MSGPRRPVLRYHGGKWLLAPWIIRHFPPHRVYVEPFGGAGSVLLRKGHAYAEVYNDLDGEVVNVFRVLRDPATAARLEELLCLTPFARVEFELSYEAAEDRVEQARRTIFRSIAGFGSAAVSGLSTGFRSNTSRRHTTPAHNWATYPTLIAAYTERLAGVVIENKPAAEVMAQHDGPETVHYADPPYPFDTRSPGNPYRPRGYRHEMTDADHRELAATLRGLAGTVVLSGYACPLYDSELYPDWHREERAAYADGARGRTEVLWINRAPNQPGLFA